MSVNFEVTSWPQFLRYGWFKGGYGSVRTSSKILEGKQNDDKQRAWALQAIFCEKWQKKYTFWVKIALFSKFPQQIFFFSLRITCLIGPLQQAIDSFHMYFFYVGLHRGMGWEHIEKWGIKDYKSKICVRIWNTALPDFL